MRAWSVQLRQAGGGPAAGLQACLLENTLMQQILSEPAEGLSGALTQHGDARPRGGVQDGV